MSDKYIVTTHLYHRHKTVKAAIAEQKRLADKHPGKKFRIVRVGRPSMTDVLQIAWLCGVTEKVLKSSGRRP